MVKKRTSSESIDFDTLSNYVDPVKLYLDAQSHLYRINNPYVGNKRKIVGDIADALNKHDYKFDTLLDLFSGSGMVSLFFKLLGKTVTSNDLLTSSYYNALVFVENSEDALSSEQIKFLCKNDNPDRSDFVQTNYTDRFTPEEALFLDNYRANVELLTDRIAKATAILLIEQYVMQHCFLGGRLNSGQILAKLDHRLKHDRNHHASITVPLEMTFKLTSIPSFKGPNGLALNLDCLDALKQSGGSQMAYIDPPYGGSQSDYAFMFAFCEEYIYGKKINELPHIINSKKFVTAKDYDKHFRDVLDGAKGIPQWAISYNDSSWANVDTIQKLVGDFKKSVTVVNIDYEYKYRKDNGSATEYLILAR